MPWTNASIVLNSRDATGGVPQDGNLYNALTFNAENQNIIQGQIESISVSEVNFPYDIPNVITTGPTPTDTLILTNLDDVAGLAIVLTAGFYTGTELATAINDQIAAEAAAVGANPLNCPVCVFNATENLFQFNPPPTPTTPQAWVLTSAYTFPAPGYPGALPTNKLGKDLPSIMGFLPSQGAPITGAPGTSALYIVNTNYVGPSTIPANVARGDKYAAAAATLLYTQYVDICSPQLCKFQFFRDGSTTNLARRSDVICRLYISNNVATQEEEGTRPFVISRQFLNSRVMRWTADNAVGTIDINLYDDCGNALATEWRPRPYQITFNCYETPKEDPQKY